MLSISKQLIIKNSTLILVITSTFYASLLFYIERNFIRVRITSDMFPNSDWTKRGTFNSNTIIQHSDDFQFTSISPVSECSGPVITANDRGRLGNQICLFMALQVLKIEFDWKIAVPPKMLEALPEMFENVPPSDLPMKCFSKMKNLLYEEISFQKLYEKLNSSYISEIPSHLKLRTSNINNFIIKDRPCPKMTLLKHRQRFQSLLKIKEDLLKTSKLMLQNALKSNDFNVKNRTLICTHIRRSDYLKYGERIKLIFPTKVFYRNAFEFYRKNCKNSVFVVVSDDLEWCKEHLSDQDVVFPGNGNITSPQLDFTLLTLCHHHIIDLGTFGVTSAFLGNGSAVIFRRRTQENNTIEYSSFDLLKRNFSCSSSSEFIFVD